MSFFKRVKENTDDKYHKYLPTSEQASQELTLLHIKGEEGKDSSPDAAFIMDRLNNKDTPQQLKLQLEGPQSSAALTASGEQLKDIFLECVFVRTKKSLEHLKLFVERFYTEIFEPWFVKSEPGQLTLIKTTLRVLGAPRNN